MRVNLFEELGEVIGRKEELLLVNDPEEPKHISTISQTFVQNCKALRLYQFLQGGFAKLRSDIFNKNIVFLNILWGTGGLLLVELLANEKRDRYVNNTSDGDIFKKPKKLKVLPDDKSLYF